MDNYTLMPKEQNEMRIKLNNMLFEAGVDPSIIGYKYLIDACMFSILNRELFENQLVKGIYGLIAEKYSSTPNRVERAIRRSIFNWWEYKSKSKTGNELVDSINKCYGKMPTNKQLIASIIRYFY